MEYLKCIICGGEVDIVESVHSINKKIKCKKCGFTNTNKRKEPEVLIIRRKPK